MSAAFADGALALIGTPFRLRGRSPETGVDCVGLVTVALAAIDRPAPPIPHYAMRQLDTHPLLPLLAEAGFAETRETLAKGDLLLLRPSSAQAHLAIVTGPHAIVQAHAGLGRVTLSPLPQHDDIRARWRLT
ncbi:MAG: NlpC/P60 family protein [Alteraurantiacibacter sp.]